MCRLVLEKLARRPDEVRALARANVDVWERAGSRHPRYVSRWRELLRLEPERLREILLGDSDEAQVMRANNPFAGLLTREERDHVLAAGDVADHGRAQLRPVAGRAVPARHAQPQPALATAASRATACAPSTTSTQTAVS